MVRLDPTQFEPATHLGYSTCNSRYLPRRARLYHATKPLSIPCLTFSTDELRRAFLYRGGFTQPPRNLDLLSHKRLPSGYCCRSRSTALAAATKTLRPIGDPREASSTHLTLRSCSLQYLLLVLFEPPSHRAGHLPELGQNQHVARRDCEKGGGRV